MPRRTPRRHPAAKRRKQSPEPQTSISDERLARSDHGPLFTVDGRKSKYTERVGAVAPDTDPAESPSRKRPKPT